MIRFQLCCDADHEFDGWFRNGDDFDVQKKRGLVSCPVCHSAKVEKMLMAPAVSTGRKKETMALAMGEQQRKAIAQLKALAEKVREADLDGLIAHELAHAHLRNGGYGAITDPEHAADALAAEWGFGKVARR